MTVPAHTPTDARRWRRLADALRLCRRQINGYGDVRRATLAELKRATHDAGKAVFPARDEREVARLRAVWLLCGSYLAATELARKGMNAALIRAVDIVEAILGSPGEPPPAPVAPAQRVNARMPYADN